MLRPLVVSAILIGYTATLAVSSWHLAEWYSLTKGSLPANLSFALAITLETNAFILSLLSNSLLRRSVWAQGGALLALSLVWLGNYLSMERAAPQLAPVEILAASAFVPIGTFIMAKVLGELLNQRPVAVVNTVVERVEAPRSVLDVEGSEIISVLRNSPLRLRDLAGLLPHLREKLPELLQTLERENRIRLEDGYWKLVGQDSVLSS